MRHMCSGEDVCGMVKKNDQGYVVSVNEQMDNCAEQFPLSGSRHCCLIRSNVYFDPGENHRKKEARHEESMYQLRMLPLFKDETKAEFTSRMRRAINGPYERKPRC